VRKLHVFSVCNRLQFPSIWLYGIDCPEQGQAFGQKAKQATAALIRLQVLADQYPTGWGGRGAVGVADKDKS
jgi:endonuclease YncB( thermonuclease family)